MSKRYLKRDARRKPKRLSKRKQCLIRMLDAFVDLGMEAYTAAIQVRVARIFGLPPEVVVEGRDQGVVVNHRIYPHDTMRRIWKRMLPTETGATALLERLRTPRGRPITVVEDGATLRNDAPPQALPAPQLAAPGSPTSPDRPSRDSREDDHDPLLQ